MAWFKIDDKFHAHRKPRKAKLQAVGLWTLAGSWSMDNGTDGFIPRDVIAQWGATSAVASRLVSVGLWDEAEVEGERGWQFHDWWKFQPDAASMQARKDAESEGGRRGNHTRWHKAKRLFVPGCEFCEEDRVPDQEPDRGGDAHPDIGPESAPIPPVPVPDPTTTSNEEVGDLAPRADVLRVCEYLADAIAENGSKRPTVTKAWHDEARRMLDLDGRTETEVIRAIDWCQRGESERARFWRPNVMSMTKLRAKFDQMRLQAMNEARPEPQTNTQRHMALVRELAEREQTQTIIPFGQIGGPA